MLTGEQMHRPIVITTVWSMVRFFEAHNCSCHITCQVSINTQQFNSQSKQSSKLDCFNWKLNCCVVLLH